MSESPEERRLLDAVLAAPEDDAPREVYADWLIARGDPRGDFIACQLAAARGAAEAGSRARALFATHGEAWAAALGGVEPSDVTFERGFPVSCAARADALEGLRPGAAWSTVTRLEITGAAWRDALKVATALETLSGIAALSVAFDQDAELEEDAASWLALLGGGRAPLTSIRLSCPRGVLELTAVAQAPPHGSLSAPLASPGSWGAYVDDPLERALKSAIAAAAGRP